MHGADKLLRRATRSPARRGATAFAASLVLHTVVLALVRSTGLLDAASAPGIPVAFVALTADQWTVNRLASGPTDVARPRVDRFVAVPPDVESDPLRAEVEPRDASHLAESPQTVVEERVSRHAGQYEQVLRVPQTEYEGFDGSGERGKDTFSVRGKVGPKGAGDGRTKVAAIEPAEDPLAPGSEAELDGEDAGPPFEAVVPVPGAEGGRRIIGDLVPPLPTREFPRPGGGPTMDGVGEVPEGDETRLDTHEVGSAAFWVDVRNRIEGEWQKRAVATFSRLDPREEVYFWKQRTAVLKVALGAAGELKKVEVVESSTLGFFDDVALEAIRASTYPPPPAEALAGNGVASIQVRVTWVPSLRHSGLR